MLPDLSARNSAAPSIGRISGRAFGGKGFSPGVQGRWTPLLPSSTDCGPKPRLYPVGLEKGCGTGAPTH